MRSRRQLLPAGKAGVNEEPIKPVVVVIDDEVQLRRLLRVSLEANGYKVFEAADG